MKANLMPESIHNRVRFKSDPQILSCILHRINSDSTTWQPFHKKNALKKPDNFKIIFLNSIQNFIIILFG
ncbi:hypothetical protein HRM2_19550 [Desulforapulum autotrophicum HRM2]|uniref:Uncharacterized protein n=1 Tax=Desulforapulum autotrophicum (strain ATCC 43914 / DSM 3382 / VKM B-1955 / HRM2) TaxID=177437 RepID=C0QCH9_DESAH|nr:hypothetical protein HRM2_19550 [Desulforapulum autotrophicum HRM2]